MRLPRSPLSSDNGGPWLAPDHAFFEQAVVQGEIGNHFLERRRLGAQLLHLRCPIVGKTIHWIVF
jgi:hypothetical protein